MLFKTILIFLGAMVLVAMIGKALFPGHLSRMVTKRPKPAVCAKCGRYLMGNKGCDCGGKV